MSEAAFTGERAESRPRSYDPASAWDEPDARLLNGGPRVAPLLPLECLGEKDSKVMGITPPVETSLRRSGQTAR